jgi:hypothetical protein
MEQDEIIARAVNIVKSNNRKLKIVLAVLGKFTVVTDQKTFEVDNTERYTEDEIKEIFERKGYTNVRVIELDAVIIGYPYTNINNVPEASTLSSPGSGPSSTSATTSTTSPSSSSSSTSSSSNKMSYYTLGSNKGIFYIKEDSENPYVKDAFERLLTRRFSDLEISSYDVSERPTIDEKDYQSLSDFVANPKFKTRPPVNMNAFSNEKKTYYYKVETNNGTFLIRDESVDLLDADDIKLVLKRNFRDIQINNLRRSLGTVHTGHSDSDYQTFEEFFRSPRDVRSSAISSPSSPIDMVKNQIATMDAPPNPISVMLSRDISDLPTDMQKEITSHRTNYWVAHTWLRNGLKRYGIGPSTTVSSLPDKDRETGEILINLYDDIENGQVTQKELIDRIKKMQDIYNMRSQDRAGDFAEIFFGKKRK